MDLVATVKDSLDRVTKKQKLYYSVSQDVIDLVRDGIEETLNRILLVNDGVEHESVLTELRRKLDALLPFIRLQRSQKKTNLCLGRFGKILESSYQPDISRACRSIDFDIRLVNKILIHHFYRQGLFEVGDCLIKETGEEEEPELRSQSLEIHQLTESMKHRNIEPALRWISANREKLKHNGSKLELKLISLKFCDMVREGNQSDAMKYARTHFPPLYDSLNGKEIQKLMVCVVWMGSLERCPYAEMVSPSRLDNVTNMLIKEYHHLLDQPSNSPLTVALSAGLESLPTLLKLVDVMALKKQEWQAMKQHPVPMDLGNEFQFHSVFVCPVSRDQSSEDNPPMMMPCRHVISKQSITRLSKNCPYRRFKCPCCPAATSAAACRQLYF
ncbi:RMD5-like protein [Cardamine amara subsp. amara]|uniref:RMD5-like protein n=1 Tax=Cardamine amara subsp. amara TaxID=228776 RepID=A0ABD0ZQM3_CARAN